MPTTSGACRHLFLAMVLLFVFGGIASADWFYPVWDDDFQDGNATANPAWTGFAGPAGGSSTVIDMGGGDYGYRHTANYLGDPLYAGWAGAYVDVLQADQGIEAWVSPHATAANGVAALGFLRYTPSAIGGFGTGYALAISYNGAGNMTASVHQLNDTGTAEIGSETTVVSGARSDMMFRFLIMGAGANTQIMGRAWAAGTDEPEDWLFDFNYAASPYEAGYGGVGVVTQNPAVPVADVTFDNVMYGTPEPTTMLLMATGIGALVLRRRRKA